MQQEKNIHDSFMSIHAYSCSAAGEREFSCLAAVREKENIINIINI